MCIPKAGGKPNENAGQSVLRYITSLIAAGYDEQCYVILASNAELSMAMRRPNPSRASLPDARVSGRRHHCAGWRKWLPAHSPGLEA